LDSQRPAVENGPVHGVHRVLGVVTVVESDERESSAVLGVIVSGDVNVADVTVFLEDLPQGLGRRPVGQVVHLQRRHSLHIGRRTNVIPIHFDDDVPDRRPLESRIE